MPRLKEGRKGIGWEGRETLEARRDLAQRVGWYLVFIWE